MMTMTTYTCPNPTWCAIDHAEHRHGQHICDSGERLLCDDETGNPDAAVMMHYVNRDDAAEAGGRISGAASAPARSYLTIGIVDPRFGLDDGLVTDRDQLRVMIAGLQPVERQVREVRGKPVSSVTASDKPATETYPH
jgi:hypothetical protein